MNDITNSDHQRLTRAALTRVYKTLLVIGKQHKTRAANPAPGSEAQAELAAVELAQDERS